MLPPLTLVLEYWTKLVAVTFLCMKIIISIYCMGVPGFTTNLVVLGAVDQSLASYMVVDILKNGS